MALKDVVGQEKALEILRGCIIKNRLAHAYLFTGESGIGKKLTAINFVKTLNCQKPVISNELQVTSQLKDSNEPFVSAEIQKNSSLLTPHSSLIRIDCCDKCPSCIKIDKAIHPDVFFIRPEGSGGQITIKTIRELEESLSYKAFEGGWKIAIIDEAESLNQAAANAFLKTLEEPPEQSILILISSMPELILNTIRSRCQRINFSPLPLKMMIELLKDKTQNSKLRTNSELRTPNSELNLLSMLSCGRPGAALSEDLIDRRNHSLDKFKSLLGSIEGTTWENRDSMEEWFEWAQLWLRDMAVFKATNNTDLLINQDKKIEIKDISQEADLRDILMLSDKLNNIKNLLRFNLNKELTFYYTSLLLKNTFGRIDVRRENTGHRTQNSD